MKNIFLFLVVVVLLVVGGSFLLDSKIHVEETLVISASAGKIYENVNTLKNWERWSPWVEEDKDMKMTYNKIPSGKGAEYVWDSRLHGRGKLTITEVKQGMSVKYDIVFGDDFENPQGKGEGEFLFKAQSGGNTEVTWTFDSDLGWNPIAKYYFLFTAPKMKETFTKGLKNLKAETES